MRDRLRFTMAHPESESGHRLTQRLDEELAQRYPKSSLHSATSRSLERSIFVVALLDDAPVACGAVCNLDDGIGEIKRVYVEPAFRGKGIARRLLMVLETLARKAGFVALRVETGVRQPEAIKLYDSAGYESIARFGPYVKDPLSVCFQKRL